MASGLEFDVMMERKSKDLSLLKLRPDLLRYAPDVAALFSIFPSDAALLEADEKRLEPGVEADGDGEVENNS